MRYSLKLINLRLNDIAMPYDEYLADRIRQTLKEKKVAFEEKKMMGGICYMVDDKMCVGTLNERGSGEPLLMARIGEQQYVNAIGLPGCKPMDFTGRPLKGYVFIDSEGTDMDEDLDRWIQMALDFNPQAKSSKKKKN